MTNECTVQTINNLFSICGTYTSNCISSQLLKYINDQPPRELQEQTFITCKIMLVINFVSSIKVEDNQNMSISLSNFS